METLEEPLAGHASNPIDIDQSFISNDLSWLAPVAISTDVGEHAAGLLTNNSKINLTNFPSKIWV